MSKWILSIVVVLLVGLFFAEKKINPKLILNASSHDKMPKSYHTTPHNASGSGQFSQEGLQWLSNHLPKESWIIDLREESHGFLNGDAVSWLVDHNWINRGKTKDEVIESENAALNHLFNKHWAIVFIKNNIPSPYKIQTVINESELVTQNQMHYLRLPVSDHTPPKDLIVDEFIQFIDTHPDATHLHFHCSAGRGRTTTFLAMHAILLFGTKTPLEELIKNEETYGGIDLLTPPDKNEWKYPYIIERIEFIKNFYDYQNTHPTHDIKWSEWIAKKTDL